MYSVFLWIIWLKGGDNLRIDENKLEKIMAEKCMTKSDIALKAKLSRNRLYRIVEGDNLQPKTVGKIAKALNVKIEEIIETRSEK